MSKKKKLRQQSGSSQTHRHPLATPLTPQKLNRDRTEVLLAKEGQRLRLRIVLVVDRKGIEPRVHTPSTCAASQPNPALKARRRKR